MPGSGRDGSRGLEKSRIDPVKFDAIIPQDFPAAVRRHFLMEELLGGFGKIRVAMRIVDEKTKLSSPINWQTKPTSASSPSQPITHWRLKYSLGFIVSKRRVIFSELSQWRSMRCSHEGAQPQLHSREANFQLRKTFKTPPTMMSTMVTIWPVTWVQIWRSKRLPIPKRSRCG